MTTRESAVTIVEEKWHENIRNPNKRKGSMNNVNAMISGA